MRWKAERDVRRFHKRFGHPVLHRPGTPPEEWRRHRRALVLEEAQELAEAIDSGNLLKIAREAVDVIYVAIGTLVAFGLPVDQCWVSVHKSNMLKLPNPTPASKPIKPPHWQSPDEALRRVIRP